MQPNLSPSPQPPLASGGASSLATLTPGGRVVPSRLARDGGHLLEVAMWCLGQDVRHTDGNLLEHFGCRREARPQHVVGTSAYADLLRCGTRVTLWGFGVVVVLPGAPEGWFFDRTLRHPQRVERSALRSPVFEVGGLGEQHSPVGELELLAARRAAVALARWFSRYETWISVHTSASYRASLLSGRRRPAPCAPEALPQAWRRLRRQLSALLPSPDAPSPARPAPPRGPMSIEPTPRRFRHVRYRCSFTARIADASPPGLLGSLTHPQVRSRSRRLARLRRRSLTEGSR